LLRPIGLQADRGVTEDAARLELVQEDAPAFDGNLELVARPDAEHAPHLHREHDAPEVVDLPRHAGGPRLA